jgi:hypothetical protein
MHVYCTLCHSPQTVTMYSGILTRGDGNSDIPLWTDRLQYLSKIFCYIFFGFDQAALKNTNYFTNSTKTRQKYFDLLNAELNSICHLLVLLGDLTFMGKCIVSIANKMQRHTFYLYL